ncbi:helix-turn-helix domain-containing protein, partial [Blautia wexlerae]|uniref:helix-turn-helix domain-containing protein n=1 Tax=Blautia wexlerae TaxID=418240 RepID=UPI001A9B4262
QLIACLCRLEIIMKNKGNQKHLTFEQRVDIEKGLTENKSFTEIGRIIGKNPSTISKDVGRILRTFKIKKNVEVTDNGKIII